MLTLSLPLELESEGDDDDSADGTEGPDVAAVKLEFGPNDDGCEVLGVGFEECAVVLVASGIDDDVGVDAGTFSSDFLPTLLECNSILALPLAVVDSAVSILRLQASL